MHLPSPYIDLNCFQRFCCHIFYCYPIVSALDVIASSFEKLCNSKLLIDLMRSLLNALRRIEPYI